MKSKYLFLILIAWMASCHTSKTLLQTTVTKDSLSSRLEYLSIKMKNYLVDLKVDSLNVPRAIDENGKLISGNTRQWTSGFFPGTLWQLYGFSKDQNIKVSAETWTAFVEKEKWDTHTHDLGFKVNSCFGKGYEITKNEAYKEVIITASNTLIKRYNPTVRAIRSWDWNKDVWQFPVIIDNMLNLEMLFDATDFTGDSIYYNIAYNHAKTTLKNHFRADNSSYHVIDYDPIDGSVRMKNTHQGLNHESAWSRGQSWGLNGFTHAYKRTKDKSFLLQARKIADFMFLHKNMPKDLIPYWDFDAPNIPNEPRDVSAAVVAASALIELSILDKPNSTKYLKWVDTIILSLNQETYQSDVNPFLLSQSTGSLPGNFEINVPIVYGDYYYVETLIKRYQTLKK